MEYARLGNTGLKVSRICLGCMSYGEPNIQGADGTRRWPWALGEDDARPFFKRALEVGINFFDTANVYSAGTSEEITGRALKDFARRDDIVLATKVHGAMSPGPNGHGLSRKAIFQELDASLRRLGTDYVDLYQIHRWTTPRRSRKPSKPCTTSYAREGPLHRGVVDVRLAVQQGAVPGERHGWTRFVSMQNHYNLLYREEEREMNGLCADQGVGLIPWSPLARGRLARSAAASEATSRSKTDGFGKMVYGASADLDVRVLERVDALSRARGVPNAQLALAWVLRQKGVASAIIGATKMPHLDDAVAALSVKLTDDEAKRLEEPYVPHAVAGFS